MLTTEQMIEGESRILQRVRASKGLSRVEIARELAMSPSAVGRYVERLLEHGYLKEGERRLLVPRGRPMTLLELPPQAGFMIGIDVVYHFVRVVALDFVGQSVMELSQWLDREADFTECLDLMVHLAKICREAGQGEFLGIGIAHPLPNPTVFARHMTEWNEPTVAKRFAEDFGATPQVQPSHHAVGTAELRLGSGRHLKRFISLEARAVVGATLVMDGKLINEEVPESGLVGNWEVPRELLPPLLRDRFDGPFPINRIASVPGILTLHRALRPDSSEIHRREKDFTGFFASLNRNADANDKVAQALIDGAAAALGWCAARMADLFAPEAIILSYPFATLGESFLGRMRSVLRKATPLSETYQPDLRASLLSDSVGAIGAASLALHCWRPRTAAQAV